MECSNSFRCVTSYSLFVYGIIKNVINYCHSTTAVRYQVDFAIENISIPYNVWVLTQPVFDNDMVILHFLDNSTSIDDANDNKLFTKVSGQWYKQIITQTNFY